MLIGQGSRFLDPFIFKMKNIIISQLRKTLQDNSKSAAERETARKELLKILEKEEVENGTRT